MQVRARRAEKEVPDMINTISQPVMSGTHALGTPAISSWLPSRFTALDVPVTGYVSSDPAGKNATVVADTDAARKRGRPPRGEPR